LAAWELRQPPVACRDLNRVGEFKEQVARKVVDNWLPIAQVARVLSVSDTTFLQCRLLSGIARSPNR
jgi:hypothetical protein